AGYYTSWLLSSPTVGNLVSSYAWGVVADRFGRKPVIMVGLCSTCLFSITFGLSESFAAAASSRFLFGLCNCLFPIARILVVELLGPKRAVIGIVVLPGSRAVGYILGPTLAGFLSQPAISYPSSFSSTGLFARYPFLLPNLAVALVAFAALPFVYFNLPETLNSDQGGARNDTCNTSKRLVEDGAVSAEDGGSNSGIMLVASPESMRAPARGNFPYVLGMDRPVPLGTAAPAPPESGNGSEDEERLFRSAKVQDPKNTKNDSPLLSDGHRRTIGSYSGAFSDDDSPPPALGSSLFGPDGLLTPLRVRLLLLLQCLVVMVDFGFCQVYPLWLLASKDAGGLQWSLPKVGKVLGWTGIGLMLFQFIVYPSLCRTIGIIWLLRGSSVLAAAIFVFIPDIQRANWGESGSYVVGVTVATVIGCCTSVAETAINLASANAVPVTLRGKVAGFFAISASLGQAIGPASFSCLLAWSLGSNKLLDYHAMFVALMVVMVVAIAIGRQSLTLEALTVSIENRHLVEYEEV
ncbi:unnamed protein product, partial [Hapterophycus canaliculatus]